jgi:hypothetical protein
LRRRPFLIFLKSIPNGVFLRPGLFLFSEVLMQPSHRCYRNAPCDDCKQRIMDRWHNQIKDRTELLIATPSGSFGSVNKTSADYRRFRAILDRARK